MVSKQGLPDDRNIIKCQKIMDPVKTIEEAIQIINSFKGNPDDFILAISDELQDPLGMNMTIIVDSILAKGWEPDGFVQQDGYRIYKYKALE